MAYVYDSDYEERYKAIQREKKRQYLKEWRKKNRERIREYYRQWMANRKQQ